MRVPNHLIFEYDYFDFYFNLLSLNMNFTYISILKEEVGDTP